MTPERWQRIGELYASAVELPPGTRAAFLRDACVDDDALRTEVESLLASGAAAGAFMDAGAIADAARMLTGDGLDSLAGSSLGHYQVLAFIGAGGMGEVYRAHDSRLHRDVAVKVITALRAQSDDARTRFLREAQAVAALSHPNIRSLYDVGEADGRVYAVMELLDGETLRSRLARGPIPFRKAIEICAAIADGVAAAHASGIVHRDLKPENVFITAGGLVKVLDFGLAKMPPLDADAGSESMPGAILGTASYMSPEQVSGSHVDARSDIFSLGCVLYEMVSGRRAFARKTGVETMTAILNDEPMDPEMVDAGLRHIIAHCLEKRPEARFQSSQDLAFHLRNLPGAAAETPVSGSRRRRLVWPAVAMLFLVTTLALSFVHFRQPASPAHRVQFDMAAPDGATVAGGAFALSPDGSRLAFVSSTDETPAHFHLWVHSFETGESQRLAGAGDVGNNLPVWSPDGRFIAFTGDGRIKKIAWSGGAPQTVVERPSGAPSTWSADDTIVLAGSVLMKVPASGGEATPLTALDPGRSEIGHYSARILPDGRHFIYARTSLVEGMSGVFVGSLDAKPEQQDARQLVATRGRAEYVPSADDPRVGHLLFNREGTLLAQGFDAAALKLTGEPVPVVEGIEETMTPRRPGYFSVSRNGALAYRRKETVAGMPVWLDPTGHTTTPLLDTPLTRPEQPRLSADGRRLALIVARDVWVYDLGGRPPIKLTSDGGNDSPLWTPDGKRIVYARASQPYQLLSLAVDSADATPESLSPPGHFHPHGWSADGRELIAVLNTYSTSGWDIVGIPMRHEGATRSILRTPSDEGVAGAALSPNGRWLAYSSNATGQTEVWVRSYSGSGAPIRVSPHGGVDPQWARDGGHLYYLENRRLMSVEIESGADFDFRPPAFMFEMPDSGLFPNQSYDVAPDGRFITIKRVDERASATPISVILNWTAGLTSANW